MGNVLRFFYSLLSLPQHNENLRYFYLFGWLSLLVSLWKKTSTRKKNQKLFPCLLRYSCYKRINRPKFILDLHKFYSHLWQDESISIEKKRPSSTMSFGVSTENYRLYFMWKTLSFLMLSRKKSTNQTFLSFFSTMKNTGVAKRNAHKIKHTMYQHRELSPAKRMWGGKFILMSQYVQMN